MTRLSIVVPAYNEERSLRTCIDRVMSLRRSDLELEVLVVNDASRDGTLELARQLAEQFAELRVLNHEVNQGKGAALHTGFRHATGHYVAVQDADLEYDPQDLLRLLTPLLAGKADVVLGSRFLSVGEHRVLYFWHSVGNRFLTLLSNMMTDLNLTDMETCYKVFRREVIQSLPLHEKRFGFEPEVVAQIARRRLRIFEMGVSYSGRTYAEGKKIGAKDGFRALYCILKYNLPHAPLPFQFAAYLVVGGIAALVNVLLFATITPAVPVVIAAPACFIAAAAVNYWLCVTMLFRRGARWTRLGEVAAYLGVVGVGAIADLTATMALIRSGLPLTAAKIVACFVVLIVNFVGRRFLVFPEEPSADWAPLVASPADPAAAAGAQTAAAAVDRTLG